VHRTTNTKSADDAAAEALIPCMLIQHPDRATVDDDTCYVEPLYIVCLIVILVNQRYRVMMLNIYDTVKSCSFRGNQ